jgi:CheY-like chemotaxis protein
MKCGFTILLAEDDPNDLTLFRYAVADSATEARININVRVVRDGVEAIEYLGGDGNFADRNIHVFPDLIVLDLKMPKLTGLDVLKWLGENPDYHRIPKILLSGSSEERDIEEAYQLGVNTYFQKPATLDEYRELVHHMILYWSHTKRPVIRQMAH